MKNLRLGLASLVAAAGMTLMGATAGATVGDVVTGTFTSDHCTGGCLTGQTNGGGTVTVTELAGNILQFAVSLANGNQFINSGFQASFGFNLVVPPGSTHPTITYSLINPAASYTIPGGSGPGGLTQGPQSLHMDGTGFFLYGLDGVGNGGSNPLGSSLSFDVQAAGLTINSLASNSAGQFFAADIISGTGARNTGGIDVSTVTGCPTCNFQQVPEPASLAILGTAFAMFGILARRRRWI